MVGGAHVALSGFREAFPTSSSFDLLAFLGAFSKVAAGQGQAFFLCPGFRATVSILALPAWSVFSSLGLLGPFSLASAVLLGAIEVQVLFLLGLGTS